MIELSPATLCHLAVMFEPQDHAAAEELLTRDCAENLPLWYDISPVGLDRVRFAAWRVSDGSLERLAEPIQLARTDWSDLLVAAGFAHDPKAHGKWERTDDGTYSSG